MEKAELLVNTNKGKIKGFEENGINKWFGIPFAKPPIGDLRFKRAVEADEWNGILECNKMSKKPYQFAGGKFAKLTKTDNEASEDCLYLNVWAPAKKENVSDNKKKPVFFWIYGGGQYAGEASAPEYYLDAFAKEDIIGVSFNYRLGVLGFYNFSHLDKSFDSNCAISDMLMALKWVNENIELFGGDKDNVTIAGESAGATSIMALIASPYARPYFNKAIIMSGVLGNISGGMIQEIHREQFLETVGIKESEISKLKNMTYEELLPGCSRVFEGKDKDYPGLLSCGPVFDDLVPEEPFEVIKRGDLKDKKLMFGTCRDEGGLFYYMKICPRTWADILNMLKINGCLSLREKLENHYGKIKVSDAVKKANRDRMFYTGAVKLALEASKHCDTYMYRFDLTTPISRIIRVGATHSMDVCPALDTNSGHMSTFYIRLKKQVFDYIHSQMHGAFVRFIKSGSPASDEMEWPLYEEENMYSYIFDEVSRVESKVNYEGYELWKDVQIYR